jgi:hypothetical protein
VIDPTLELAVDAQRPLIGERQDLGHEYAGDAFGRIDPVVGIEQPAPGEAACATPVRPWSHVDHVPEAPAHGDAREEIDVI